ncbi:MAG TPA: transcriptional regulator [Streptosporangiaceae bacterium]
MTAVGRVLQHDQQVAVGLVGPHQLVERIVLAGLPGRAGPGPAVYVLPSDDGLHYRLHMAAYRSEQEAAEKVARLGRGVDACLFASRVPLEYARRAGVLVCPSVPIQLGGGPLLATLLAAQRMGADVTRPSFDTVSRADAERALADLGLSADGAQVQEEVSGPAALASYHARLWQVGVTSVACTGLDEVARRLKTAGVPVFAVRATETAISSALRIATLLAGRRVLADSQLAVALVEIPSLRDPTGRPTARQAREELRLAVHGFLVRESQRVGGTVSQVSDHSFLVLATRGSLAAEAAAHPPFVAAARELLGVTLEVGIGLGRSEQEAEDQARLALAPHRRAAPGKGRGPGATAGVQPVSRAAVVVREIASRGALAGAAADGANDRAEKVTTFPAPVDGLSRLRSLETLARLAQKLAADASPIVDAELTGRLLSVTPRTARRQLRALAEQGLALPLPPSRNRHPGRPRQAYRLIIEKLDQRAAQ